jgi:hypothetical protein
VKEWLEVSCLEIKRRAKHEKADIYWGDETTVRASDVRGRGDAPRGETPMVNRTGKKEKTSMISAVTNKGKIYWKLHKGSINGEKFKVFAERTVQGKKRKVFLVLDNAKAHHGKTLTEWAEQNKDSVILSAAVQPGSESGRTCKCGRKIRYRLENAKKEKKV